MDVIQTPQSAWTKHVHKRRDIKGLDSREIGGKFEVGASTASEREYTSGTDKNLFRLVPIPEHLYERCRRSFTQVDNHTVQST